ncbi:MAG: GNAT family N-acetyltransferase [Bacteroidetes bacterium]|nr:GNAT family N-acetyltransferase [Bacteroidota bacterium]
MKIEQYNSVDTVTTLERKRIIDFLHDHLDEFGDTWESISNAVDYALNPGPAFGGFVLFTEEDNEVVGAVIMNHTHMKGYIPENVLVYIAVHRDHRGKGIGKVLMENAIKTAKGNIALHVEHDNPALHLYKKVGFTNPYLEMRYYKD